MIFVLPLVAVSNCLFSSYPKQLHFHWDICLSYQSFWPSFSFFLLHVSTTAIFLNCLIPFSFHFKSQVFTFHTSTQFPSRNKYVSNNRIPAFCYSVDHLCLLFFQWPNKTEPAQIIRCNNLYL